MFVGFYEGTQYEQSDPEKVEGLTKFANPLQSGIFTKIVLFVSTTYASIGLSKAMGNILSWHMQNNGQLEVSSRNGSIAFYCD